MVAKSEQASLWTLYLTAYRLYQREVIEQKKLYKRFKDDFINGNTYPKRCDVDGLGNTTELCGALHNSGTDGRCQAQRITALQEALYLRWIYS